MDQKNPEASLGRNEPCHCGSGKKYKRCHGVDAAPKLGAPKWGGSPAEGAAPSLSEAQNALMNGMDPAMMMQFAQVLQRLPKGQLQKLQSIMQRAMSGKDVAREAAEFEKSLPVELQTLIHSLSAQQQSLMGGAPAPAPSLSEDEARRIVESAALEGKISSEQAKELLEAPAAPQRDLLSATPQSKSASVVNATSDALGAKPGKLGRFWKSLTGSSDSNQGEQK